MLITAIKAVAALGAIFFAVRFLGLLPLLSRLISGVQSGSLSWPGPVVEDPNAALRATEAMTGAKPLFPAFIKYGLGIGVAAVLLTGVVLDFFGGLVPEQDSALGFYSISTIVGFVGGLVSAREVNYRIPVLRKLLARQ